MISAECWSLGELSVRYRSNGRKLLVLEDHRTRPWVVDIKTDTVTKLPWLADSMPSWQRVAGG